MVYDGGLEFDIVFFKEKTAYEFRLSLVGAGMGIRDRLGGGGGSMRPGRWP